MCFLHPPDGRLITTRVSGRLKVMHPLSAAALRVIVTYVYPSQPRAEDPNGTMVAFKSALMMLPALYVNLCSCVSVFVCMCA